MKVGRIRYVISLMALLVALAHIIWPTITIDAITVTLLVVAVLPWLSSLFKSIELPGGLKIEYQDLEKIENRARRAGLLPERAGRTVETYSFQTVASTDPNLALAGLRIELEKRLIELNRLFEALELTRQLYRHNGAEEKINSSDTLVSELKETKNKTGHKNQMEALLIIASRNGGHLKVKEAKKIMIEAGLIKTPKNAATIIYTLISRSEKFEWVASGEYRLIGSQQSLPRIS